MERQVVSVEDLGRRILDEPDLSGVTFSGGEPFAQAGGLAALGGILRNAGINVIVFTGYLYERLLAAHDPDWDRLLAVTDLLIDGPFVQALRSNLPMRGSSNKRLIFLTERLRGDPYFDENQGQAFEVHIGAEGSVSTTGFPPNEFNAFDGRMDAPEPSEER